MHCFCVRVGEAGDLPPGDRVAHLLLALREDEEGFATVANRNFSGRAGGCGRAAEDAAGRALWPGRWLQSAQLSSPGSP